MKGSGPAPILKTIRLLLTNVALSAAILIFAKGFFPHKTVLPGLAQWPTDVDIELGAAPFDKVIFMVVDALRSDFVYSSGSNFHFTQSLIRSGAAVPFTGHASPPTITMPRVKAITTGSVPSFLDLVLNFAESDTSSSLVTQDSWLAQLRTKPGSKLVMYGDDTWLRLFPGFFERLDGTSSFFVSDFTEVDHNVTRHIPGELQRDDWNGMIMHFLGLDHIGHKTGPRGPHMSAKQQEMDGIVKQIYQAMEWQPHLNSSLLVLLGDHGMNEAGNHGANSAGEVSTALTFISPKFKNSFEELQSPAKFAEDFRYHDVVDQSDVAPTLAALLGFPVPKNSLGIIVPKMLSLWTKSADRYELLFRNAEQIQKVAYATYPEAFDSVLDQSECTLKEKLSDAQRLACKWLAVKSLHDIYASKKYTFTRDGSPAVQAFLKEAQNQLSGTASKYDMPKMAVGMIVASLALVQLLTMSNLIQNLASNKFCLTVFLFATFGYAFTMFASSYIEEEHQFWYWITSAWLFSLTLKQRRVALKAKDSLVCCSSTLVCIFFGVTRRWNQTGQKYAGEEDLATVVFSKSPWLLWILVFITYSVVPRRLQTRPAEVGMKQVSILPVLVAASAFLFKVALTAAEAPELLSGVGILRPLLDFAARYSLTSLARLVFIGLGNLLAVTAFYEEPWAGKQHLSSFLETFHDIISLFLITQTRTVNIPLFLVFHIQLKLLQRGRALQPPELTITMLLQQYSSFFAFGGTNAISSVDLSNAYNGVARYSVIGVGILTFVSNWAGPIWWASATACLLRKNAPGGLPSHRFDYFGVLTFFSTVSVLAVMVACTVLREHLFIWTVFSPKYLYMMAWFFAQHVVVNGIFCGIISVRG